jgi:hypothetical protein
MAKDFTDYILMVLDSGDRVYHLVHLRNAKGCKIDGNIYPMNDHKYLLSLDRAYRINWAPWKKLVIRKPYWRYFYQPLIELTRSKKIGLLIYQEPCTQVCSACQYKAKDVCLDVFGKPIPPFVEPMHISRVHQPSGVMKG